MLGRAESPSTPGAANTNMNGFCPLSGVLVTLSVSMMVARLAVVVLSSGVSATTLISSVSPPSSSLMSTRSRSPVRTSISRATGLKLGIVNVTL